MYTREQEKALSRASRRIARKHRIKAHYDFYVWSFCGDLRVGNLFDDFSGREKRRVKGMVPELMAALRKTATACGCHKAIFKLDKKIEDCL